jgi:hypothetical protein
MSEQEKKGETEFSTKFTELQEAYCHVDHVGSMNSGPSGAEFKEEAVRLFDAMADLTATSLLKSGGGEVAQTIVDQVCELKMWRTGTSKWNVYGEQFLEKVLIRMADKVSQLDKRI